MSKIVLLIAALLAVGLCKGQVVPLADFTITAPSKPFSDGWHKLGSSIDNQFSLSIEGGNLVIERGRKMPLNEYAVSNGKLIAVNDGEFGGGLYFKPNAFLKASFLINGKQKLLADTTIDTRRKQMFSIDKKADSVIGSVVLIEPGSITAIQPFNDYWLYTEGMAHMGFNYGSLHKLCIEGNSFITQKLCDLNGYPLAITVHHGVIYIATYQSFYKIRDNNAELIIDNLFWQGLGVTSIAVKNEREVYVGISGGYVKVDTYKRKFAFYKYNKL